MKMLSWYICEDIAYKGMAYRWRYICEDTAYKGMAYRWRCYHDISVRIQLHVCVFLALCICVDGSICVCLTDRPVRDTHACVNRRLTILKTFVLLLCVSVRISVCKSACVSVCISVCISIHVSVCTCIHICVYLGAYECVPVHMWVYLWEYLCAFMCVYLDAIIRVQLCVTDWGLQTEGLLMKTFLLHLCLYLCIVSV